MSSNPQGASKERYHIVPRSLVFIFRKDHVLLIKGAPNKKIWANLFNGIGGHIEKNENIFQAAKRELREESGLQPTCIRLCGIITIDTGQTPGIGLFIFKGEVGEGQLTDSIEGALHWAPVNQISSYPLVEDLNTLLPMVAKHKNNDPVIVGHYSYNSQGQLLIEFEPNIL